MGYMGKLAMILSTSFLISVWVSPVVMMEHTISMKDFFKDEGVKDDATKVTWAHAVNSKEELELALSSDVMMLEADIIMGHKKSKKEKNSSSKSLIPIMAHPPNITSDLTFEDFLKAVIKANEKDGKKKGIKLDFKDIDAVQPVMKWIDKRKVYIKFPLLVNADIWTGPVNATTQPLDPTTFLSAVDNEEFHLRPTLSLGWTTRYGYVNGTDEEQQLISIAQYTNENLQEAIRTLSAADLLNREVTFPVRAGIAAQSIGVLLNLVEQAGPNSSLTLWSKKGDPVDMENLEHLIKNVGRHRVYTDLPFSLPNDNPSSSNPGNPPTPKSQEENNMDFESTTISTTTSTTTTEKSKPSKKDKQANNVTIVDDTVKDNSTHPHPKSGATTTASLTLLIVTSLFMLLFTNIISQ